MIELKDLQKAIEGVTVLDIPALEVRGGEIVALVGPATSGKEVLFELMSGRTRPTLGSVKVAGIDPYKDRQAFSRRVGVLFAEDNLYVRQSVQGNLRFFSRLHRLSPTRLVEILNLVGLADQADTTVEKLSPSLVRRLSFGRAILQSPKVLMLAEPFANCDQASISLLLRLIRSQADDDVAILILSAELTHLVSLCDSIYRLDSGRIVEQIEVDDDAVSMPFMIPARLEGKVALVDPAEILFVFAQDDRAYLQTVDAQLPTHFTLAELEKRLARSGFFRAHRGYLVNLQHVKEVIPYTRDSYSLRLKDQEQTEIPLSKSSARELRELLGY